MDFHEAVEQTPATSLEPVVLALAFPLDHFSDMKRGDLLLGLQPVLHIILPRLHALEKTVQLCIQCRSKIWELDRGPIAFVFSVEGIVSLELAFSATLDAVPGRWG